MIDNGQLTFCNLSVLWIFLYFFIFFLIPIRTISIVVVLVSFCFVLGTQCDNEVDTQICLHSSECCALFFYGCLYWVSYGHVFCFLWFMILFYLFIKNGQVFSNFIALLRNVYFYLLMLVSVCTIEYFIMLFCFLVGFGWLFYFTLNEWNIMEM